MAERNYYVICDDGCKFPAMTKEQIYALLDETIASGQLPTDYQSGGFVTKIKEQNKKADLSFWVGTQAQYNALNPKPQNTFCIITDDTSKNEIIARIEELTTKVNKFDAFRPSACSMMIDDTTEITIDTSVYDVWLSLDVYHWKNVNKYQVNEAIIQCLPAEGSSGEYRLKVNKNVNALISLNVMFEHDFIEYGAEDIRYGIICDISYIRNGKSFTIAECEDLKLTTSDNTRFTVSIPMFLCNLLKDDYLSIRFFINNPKQEKIVVDKNSTALNFLFLNE